jgi:DNA-binding MarR family transcriptional regulator
MGNIMAMAKAQTPDTPAEHLHHHGDEPHLLREIVRTHQALMQAFSRGTGMPASRFALMRLLAHSPSGGAGVMDLARQLGVNAAAVTRQVQDMERARLVLRRPDARDGRRHAVVLSAKGIRAFEAVHGRTHELERSLSEVIGPRDMAVAVSVLGRLRQFVEDVH